MNLANEGLEARKKDEEVTQRKRKAEEDKVWEGEFHFSFPTACIEELCETYDDYVTSIDTREQRVDSWRSFANGKKKKKSKIQILG
jgi:DnaJ family protein C protein 8